MFKCLVILKRSPWYIFAVDEEDAMKISEPIIDQVSGVVLSNSSLEVKLLELKPTLHSKNQLQLESKDGKKLNELCDGISEKEIFDDINTELERCQEFDQ